MARYYFSLEDGHPLGDPLGEDLPDNKAALETARGIATDLARSNCSSGALRIVVRDRENRKVGEVSLMAARLARKTG